MLNVLKTASKDTEICKFASESHVFPNICQINQVHSEIILDDATSLVGWVPFVFQTAGNTVSADSCWLLCLDLMHRICQPAIATKTSLGLSVPPDAVRKTQMGSTDN